MLRASSLGLSLPRPTILAFQACRRLYGARSRWAALRVRSASNSSANSPLAAVAHQSTHVDQLSQPQDLQKVEYLDMQEKFRVAQPQESRISEEDIRDEAVVPSSSLISSVVLEEEQSGVVATIKMQKAVNLDGASPTGTSIPEEDQTRPPAGKERQKTLERPGRRVIERSPPYAAGKPWSPDIVKPAMIPDRTLHFLRNIERGINIAHQKYEAAKKSKGMKSKKPASARLRRGEEVELEQELELELDAPPPRELPITIREHMEILGTTASVDQAWDSYVYLIDTIANHPIVYFRIKYIPYAHLHRFSRLLAHNRPKTHTQYLRLLSVMTYIVHCGGTLQQSEWNALIDHAASARRKTRPEDVERALDLFRGMKAGGLPGSSSFRMPDDNPELLLSEQSPLEPDVYTVTTLLAIASRATDASTLKSVSLAMSKAGLAPNRITHLSLLRYFTDKKDLGGVRRTLQKMRHQDLELGLDGLNACIWAYGNNGRLDVVLMIYRILRHHLIPEKYVGPDDIHDTVSALGEESIFIENGIVPNAITYTAVIQTMAYHGHFEPSIKVFIDMLSMENVERGAPLFPSEDGDLKPAPYTPSVPVYRALFLGFARHGVPPRFDRDPGAPDWTLKNLDEIFERFLTLPETAALSKPVLDIIMSAFARTSEDDHEIMRKAWTALDNRFGIVFHKSHSESRLARLKHTLFRGDQSKLG